MKHIRTDGDLVHISRKIDEHFNAVLDLIDELKDAEHPNATTFVEGLHHNGLTAFAWAEHIVSHALLKPEQWETGDYGIRRKKASKGTNTLARGQ